jgi:hypothetical protein
MKPDAVRGIVDLANERLIVIDEKIHALHSMRDELMALHHSQKSRKSKIALDSIPRYNLHTHF